jgi:hypothetical protein
VEWIEAVVWALVFLVLGLVAFMLLNARAREYLEILRGREASKQQERQLELEERRVVLAQKVLETELSRMTAEEQATAERARLLRQAEEDRAATEAAMRPEVIEELAAEQRQIIAARAEGAALAAKEQALHQGSGSNGSAVMFEMAVDAYKTYLAEGNSATLGEFLEELDFSEFGS